MNEYEKDVLIRELQKLIVDKSVIIGCQDIKISELKKEVERLENLLTPKIEKK